MAKTKLIIAGETDANEWYREIRHLDARDRVFLEKKYLPTLKGSVLYVGVGTFTAFYHKLVKNPELFHTLDALKKVAQYGSPYGHAICDLRDFEPQEEQYDHVALYGVFGFGPKADPPTVVTNKNDLKKCLRAADSLLKPGGTLLIGTGTIERPVEFWEELVDLELIDNGYTIKQFKQGDCCIWWLKKDK